MSFDAVTAILAIPATAALLLAVLPGYKRTAYLNVFAAFLSFLAALSLFFFERPVPGPYILVDDLNNVFIVLTTFVGFTTSVFSASYIEHELEIGRLTPTFLRFSTPGRAFHSASSRLPLSGAACNSAFDATTISPSLTTAGGSPHSVIPSLPIM